jgi:general secretion pathway protein G
MTNVQCAAFGRAADGARARSANPTETPMQPIRPRARSSRAGFSLAELMVVVVILGLLALVVMPNLIGRFFTAQREVAKVNIIALCDAIDTFTIENGGRAPENLTILVTPDANGRTYLRDQTTVPVDPWKNEYGYDPPTAGRSYRVYSLGKDGQPGGEGDDADIDNFTIRGGESR